MAEKDLSNSNAAALLYLSSPALPIGAFAYSQGLEQAIELGWVRDADSLFEWTDGVLSHSLCQTDIPVFVRLRWCLSENQSLHDWNDFMLANRETEELYNEDINLGKALLRLLRTQDLLKKIKDMTLPSMPSFITAYAIASHELNVPVQQASMGLLWSWLENQVTVSCKVIPIGQTDGQSVLLRHMPNLERRVNEAFQVSDSDVGGSLPGMAMTSALHETQYSRLFRS